jgi:hypothetical protein
LHPLEQSDNYDSAEEDAYEASPLPHASTLRSQVQLPGPTLRAVGGDQGTQVDQGTQRHGTKAAKAPPPVSSPRTQASREHGARAVNPWLLIRQVVSYSTTPDLYCASFPLLT